MDERASVVVAAVGALTLFALVQIGALTVVQPFANAGFSAPSDPSNPANSLLYFVAILVGTGVMLAAIKLGVQGLIRALVLATSALLTWIVLTVLFGRFLPAIPGSLVAGVLALGLAALLYVYPEWYVIDLAGVVMGAGAAGLFGITFGVLPAIALLVVLAVYDAISVYGTEHMLTLADNAMELRIPVFFVVPTTISYSFLPAPDDGARTGGPVADDGTAEDGEAAPTGDPPASRSTDEPGGAPAAGSASVGPPEDDIGLEPDPDPEPRAIDPDAVPSRDALFIGLGDAVMPTILAVSAAFFLEVPRFDLPLLLNVPALGALVGTMFGLVALQWLVFRGRAHAGLPLLNGGAIAGYVVGALLAGIPVLEALGLAGYP
jgi:presenilin-like A22 family membrane protease